MKYIPMLLAVNCIVFAMYAVPHIDDINMTYYLAMGSEVAGIPVSLAELYPGLITYMFGHAGLIHLATNMAMLLMVGWHLERRAGPRVILYYIAGGLAGAVAHLTLADLAGVDAPLIGASASVSALLGAALFHRTVGLRTIGYFVVVLNIFPWLGEIAGLVESIGVSFVSHIAGCIMGAIAGACFSLAGYVNRRRKRTSDQDDDDIIPFGRQADSTTFNEPKGVPYYNPTYENR